MFFSVKPIIEKNQDIMIRDLDDPEDECFSPSPLKGDFETDQ